MSSQHRGHLAAAEPQPDFKTIADFRRDNRSAFKSVFRQFVLLCRRLDLYGRELLVVDAAQAFKCGRTQTVEEISICWTLRAQSRGLQSGVF